MDTPRIDCVLPRPGEWLPGPRGGSVVSAVLGCLPMARTSFVFALAGVVLAAPAGPPAQIVTASRLVDVRTGAYRPNQAVLVRDGKIDAVGPLADIKAKAPAGATTIDLGGATLLPGLIDCHAHLLDAMEAQWRPGAAIGLTLPA